MFAVIFFSLEGEKKTGSLLLGMPKAKEIVPLVHVTGHANRDTPSSRFVNLDASRTRTVTIKDAIVCTFRALKTHVKRFILIVQKRPTMTTNILGWNGNRCRYDWLRVGIEMG